MDFSLFDALFTWGYSIAGFLFALVYFVKPIFDEGNVIFNLVCWSFGFSLVFFT
tara:strand:- start:126 stop:287 length:162 start_codon:yes stop_codon:yes gene_type:complete